jgi:hypothetical protein
MCGSEALDNPKNLRIRGVIAQGVIALTAAVPANTRRIAIFLNDLRRIAPDGPACGTVMSVRPAPTKPVTKNGAPERRKPPSYRGFSRVTPASELNKSSFARSPLAVPVGFEPTVDFHPHNFSRVAPSAARTRNPLRSLLESRRPSPIRSQKSVSPLPARLAPWLRQPLDFAALSAAGRRSNGRAGAASARSGERLSRQRLKREFCQN